ncbi:MAG: hypothetical protein ACK4KX_03125 [Parvibaculum sp.]|uniref:hypothetical protein n=1 Tax=Parvibaculum sp. TaxID=2024848 RepID=UPI00391DDF96
MQTSSSAGDDLDTSHLDELAAEIEREEKAERGAAAYAEEIEAAAGLIPKDAFFGLFQVCFHAPNLFPLPPFPLESLPIKPDEMEAARAASDAIYDIAAESEYLRWLVEPGSVWMQRAFAILPFVAVKAAAIRAEIAARKPEPVAGTIPEPPAQASPAPATGEPKSDASTVIELAAA